MLLPAGAAALALPSDLLPPLSPEYGVVCLSLGGSGSFTSCPEPMMGV